MEFKAQWLYERETIDETEVFMLNFWVKLYSLYNTGAQKRVPLQLFHDLNSLSLLSVHISADD